MYNNNDCNDDAEDLGLCVYCGSRLCDPGECDNWLKEDEDEDE